MTVQPCCIKRPRNLTGMYGLTRDSRRRTSPIFTKFSAISSDPKDIQEILRVFKSILFPQDWQVYGVTYEVEDFRKATGGLSSDYLSSRSEHSLCRWAFNPFVQNRLEIFQGSMDWRKNRGKPHHRCSEVNRQVLSHFIRSWRDPHDTTATLRGVHKWSSHCGYRSKKKIYKKSVSWHETRNEISHRCQSPSSR